MQTATLPSPHAILLARFGLEAFRDGQMAVIEAVLAGRDTLAVMPTGRGKSLCYQLPALMLPGVTLVVSPLIALMKDQVDALDARGIPATFINGSLDSQEQYERMDRMADGEYRLVYVAPERFRQKAFLEALSRTQIALLAIDEAHCVSTWGHDFRPDYLRLSEAIAACGRPPVLATTATATPEVRTDIVQQLGLADPAVVVSGFDRPNLRYVVRFARGKAEKRAWLLEILSKVTGSAIVYGSTRKSVDEVSGFLVDQGISAVAYHAGMSDGDRGLAQDGFMSGQVRVVVATNAFGMGIDKADVRVVIHHDLPGTLEAYYQEAGRAGRDGKTAFCSLLYSAADRRIQEFFIDGNCPSGDLVRGVFREVARRPAKSSYDIAARLPGKVSGMPVETALNLLERHGLIERPKSGTMIVPDPNADPLAVIDPLFLDRRRRHEEAKLKRMVGYAYSERCRRNEILNYFGERSSTVCGRCDTCNGQRGEPQSEPPALYTVPGRSEAPTERSEPRPPARRRREVAKPAIDPSLASPELFEALRAVRVQLAKDHKVPAFVVCHDKTLLEMAARKPRSTGDLLCVSGIGEAKVERYGEAFLAAIERFEEDLARPRIQECPPF